MQLEDWLDDLCVRFIINLPPEELESVERICFQVEEAQWFYEDFIRVIDPSLPSLSLRAFSLRIFQHCPLFSTWSAQHHTTAFAEFLAYKQRVPVRGAIMLNEAMDEVVLVKGWKKGANWSFPRGKINKDENDLDCAIREVYEETGFDLREAGLVKEEKEVKAIDITMREQHMRLFVFRGVPKDTYFEPRTRKEISKIEWYKLTDLPTLKKHKHQDSGSAAPSTTTANKFYMVAPFLHPLKKWIGQQKRKENRYSSHLSAPPITADESEFDSEAIPHEADAAYLRETSDLPEVSVSRMRDPSAHLKEMLNIGSGVSKQPNVPSYQPTHMPAVDTAKSNALLNLLRGGPAVELRATPSTPTGYASIPSQIPQAAREVLEHQTFTQPVTYLPRQNVQSELSTSPQRFSAQPHQGIQQRVLPMHSIAFQQPGSSVATSRSLEYPAPYQQTGDPEFALQQGSVQQDAHVPPASALPKLTSHTKSLLDVFKGSTPPVAPRTITNPLPAQHQSLLDIFKGPSQLNTTGHAPTNPNIAIDATEKNKKAGNEILDVSKKSKADGLIPQQKMNTVVHRPKPANQSDLLNLFTQKPSVPVTEPQATHPLHAAEAPIELAANVLGTEPHKQSEEEALLALLRQQKDDRQYTSHGERRLKSTVKEGETAATINGPLNQPDFNAIARPKESTSSMGRNPLTAHRTLFDPKQPAAMKILTKPDDQRRTPTGSPRSAKAKIATSSPRRNKTHTTKEAAKPFQPQILKRPQIAEDDKSTPATTQPPASLMIKGQAAVADSMSRSRNPSSERENTQIEPRAAQAENHRQTLLSLFSGPGVDSARSSQSHTPSRVVSPLSTSQIISPTTEVPVSAVEPISTRSRMGSLASIGSGMPAARPVIEKRTTGAENKAFLLGYLGRIASQE